MMFNTKLYAAVVLPVSVIGQIHHFYSGSFDGSSLYAVAFNEEASTLDIVYNGTLDVSSSKWIAADVRLDPRLGRYYRSAEIYRDLANGYELSESEDEPVRGRCRQLSELRHQSRQVPFSYEQCVGLSSV